MVYPRGLIATRGFAGSWGGVASTSMGIIESVRGVLWARKRQPDEVAYGVALASERFDPASLLEQAVAAEQAGFDAICTSDHLARRGGIPARALRQPVETRGCGSVPWGRRLSARRLAPP